MASFDLTTMAPRNTNAFVPKGKSMFGHGMPTRPMCRTLDVTPVVPKSPLTQIVTKLPGPVDGKASVCLIPTVAFKTSVCPPKTSICSIPSQSLCSIPTQSNTVPSKTSNCSISSQSIASATNSVCSIPSPIGSGTSETVLAKRHVPNIAEPPAKRISAVTDNLSLADLRRPAQAAHANVDCLPIQRRPVHQDNTSLDELRRRAVPKKGTLDRFLGQTKQARRDRGPTQLDQVLANVAKGKRRKAKQPKPAKAKPNVALLNSSDVVGTCLVAQVSTPRIAIVATPPNGQEQSDTGSFLDQHRPKSTADLLHNAEALSHCRRWLTEHRKHNPKLQRALLLYGPSGCGKTESIRLLLNEMGYQVEEFGAESKRDPGDIQSVIKTAARNQVHQDAFEGEALPPAILLTDIESLSPWQKSAIQTLKALIAPWRFQAGYAGKQRWLAPIICIAAQRDAPSMHSLHAACNCIEFESPNPQQLLSIASNIARTELHRDQLDTAVQACRGDVRRLLLLLELMLRECRAGLPPGILACADQFEDAQSGTARMMREAQLGHRMDWEACASLHGRAVTLVPQLLHENLPQVFSSETLDSMADAFDALSMADVLEEQGLTRISIDLRDAQSTQAVYAPLAHLAISESGSNIAPISLSYPSIRSLETRERNAWVHVQDIQHCSGTADVQSNFDLMHLIAKRIVMNFRKQPSECVAWLCEVGLNWPETDYCLSRYCDLNGENSTVLGSRRVKKRPLKSSELTDLRKRLEKAIEQRETTMTRM